MDEIVVSTVVYLPPEDVYGFLADFPRYAEYSEYLTEVRQYGDGSPGTEYALTFAWWKLTYTARSEVVEMEPPTRIDWRVPRHVDARGRWRVEELDDPPTDAPPADAPPDADTACRVYLEVVFDADSVEEDSFDLPAFVSLDWVVAKIKPLLVEEAERVVERIVADVEGRRRPVEIVVHEHPDGV